MHVFTPDSDVLRGRSPVFPWLRPASSCTWGSDMCVGFGGRGGGVAQKGLSNRNTSPGPRTGHDATGLDPYGAPKGEGAESKGTTGLKTSSVTFSNELCSNERSEFDMLSHLRCKQTIKRIHSIKRSVCYKKKWKHLKDLFDKHKPHFEKKKQFQASKIKTISSCVC